MAEQTSIEWCDSTWNPWIGCTRVSPACDHCYAAVSTPARSLGVAWGAGEPRRRTSAANWELPGRWNRGHLSFELEHKRRRRVFCSSLADWLDNEVPIDWFVDLLDVVRTTPHLDWLLLSKRIGNFEKRLLQAGRSLIGATPRRDDLKNWMRAWLDGVMPANVWLGSTVVNQEDGNEIPHTCPYGQPGDRLWVRETWRVSAPNNHRAPRDLVPCDSVHYEADSEKTWPAYSGKVRPGMFMPRWASRITLEITGVRVERLQDISAADCLSEGITFDVRYGGHHTEEGRHFHVSDPRESYWSLWEAINGPGSVEANPWVWCVSFKRVQP